MRRNWDSTPINDLSLVDRRRDDGLGPDQFEFGCNGELEIAEPATLAEAPALLVHRDRSGDHQIDRLEIFDCDRPPIPGRAGNG
jgi:hypothetical protein